MKEWIVGVVFMGAGCPAFGQDQGVINPDRPGLTNGSMVVGHHVEIELGAEYERHDSGHTNLYYLPTLLRIGINNQWEFRVEGNDYTSQDASGVLSRGYQPFSFGAKYHFMDQSGTKRPSLGVMARVFPANGGGGFQSTETTGDGRFAIDWNLTDALKLSMNIGVGFYQDGNNRSYSAFLWAMVMSDNLTPALSIYIDTGLQAPESLQGQNQVLFDAGLAYVIGKNVQLDFSVGTGVSGLTSPRPGAGVGVSYRF
jgi:hypothetical protein